MSVDNDPFAEHEGPDFEVTREELVELARYWYREEWDSKLFSALHDTKFDSSFLRHRLDKIRFFIGEQAYRAVVNEVDSEVRKRIGEENWAAVTGDDPVALWNLQYCVQKEDEFNRSGVEGPAPSGPSSEGQARG
jgi:hypothetical protein